MVMLMFDGAVNLNNFLLYDKLLKIKHGKRWFHLIIDMLFTQYFD